MPILDLANNITFKGFAKLRFKFNQNSCTTCLSDFIFDESSMKNSLVILECDHVFHLNCTITYIKHNFLQKELDIKCPLCSNPIKKTLIIKILNTYNTTLLQVKDSFYTNLKNNNSNLNSELNSELNSDLNSELNSNT